MCGASPAKERNRLRCSKHGSAQTGVRTPMAGLRPQSSAAAGVITEQTHYFHRLEPHSPLAKSEISLFCARPAEGKAERFISIGRRCHIRSQSAQQTSRSLSERAGYTSLYWALYEPLGRRLARLCAHSACHTAVVKSAMVIEFRGFCVRLPTTSCQFPWTQYILQDIRGETTGSQQRYIQSKAAPLGVGPNRQPSRR